MSEHIGDLLSAYVDGQLTRSEVKKVETHLEVCDQCRDELKLITNSQTLLSQMPMLDAPRGFFVPGYKSFIKARWVLSFAAGAAVAAVIIGTVALPTSIRDRVKAQQLLDIHAISATSPTTRPGSISPHHALPYEQPAHLYGGYVRVDDWHRVVITHRNVVETSYSNGHYRVSVFEHDVPAPKIDADDNPQKIKIGSHTAKLVRYPNETLITWNDGDVAISVVCDHKTRDALAVANDLALSEGAPQFEQHLLHSTHRMMNALSGD
jgi:hypothetical protein